MYKASLSTILKVFVVCLIGGAIYGFLSSRHKAHDPAVLRQRLIGYAKPACLERARSLNQGVPDAKIVNYCDCAMARAFAQFSDAELAAAADGPPVLTDSQKARFTSAGLACRQEIFPAAH